MRHPDLQVRFKLDRATKQALPSIFTGWHDPWLLHALKTGSGGPNTAPWMFQIFGARARSRA